MDSMGNPGLMKYKYLIFTVLLALLLLLLGMLLHRAFVDPAKIWYCNPAEPRGNDEEIWKMTITPGQPIEEPNESIFESFTVGSDNDYFTVEYPYENPPDDPFAFELSEMTSTGSLEIGGGTIELAGIATAYHDANQTISDDAVYHFYDFQLQPMSDTKVRASGNYSTTEDGSNFRYNPSPAVQLIFQYQEIEHFMFHGIKIFDSRTHKSLTTGYSSSGRDGSHKFTTHVPLWHKTPVDLVIDVSYGPIKMFEFAPHAGEGFAEDNLKCRLISVFEGVDNTSGSRTSQDNMTVHKFKKTRMKNTGLTFFFACLPTASQMPVTFEFLDEEGKKLSTRGSSTSGYAHNIRLEQPLEKIALIRAYHHTRRQRIVIHLPFLPGLPQENNVINNLFDVQIPYVMLQDSDRLERFLRQSLQLNSSRSTSPIQSNSIMNASFPLELRNKTNRDIAKLYAQGASLHVDVENSQLRREYPVPLWDRIKLFLKKVFP